jgi:hypothetical protein
VYLYSGPGFSSPVLQLVALFHARSIDAFSHNLFRFALMCHCPVSKLKLLTNGTRQIAQIVVACG